MTLSSYSECASCCLPLVPTGQSALKLNEQVPAGSLPRTMEVILRNNIVESARAGDEMTFVGTLLVVPDVAAITAPGEKVQTKPGLHVNEVALSACSALQDLVHKQ